MRLSSVAYRIQHKYVSVRYSSFSFFNSRGPSVASFDKVREEDFAVEKVAINQAMKANSSCKMELAERILTDIVRQTDGVVYSFK